MGNQQKYKINTLNKNKSTVLFFIFLHISDVWIKFYFCGQEFFLFFLWSFLPAYAIPAKAKKEIPPSIGTQGGGQHLGDELAVVGGAGGGGAPALKFNARTRKTKMNKIILFDFNIFLFFK